jgi:hypothetical protein
MAVCPVGHVDESCDARYYRRSPDIENYCVARLELTVGGGDTSRPQQPATAADELAALAHEAVDRNLFVPIVCRLLTDALSNRAPVGPNLRITGDSANPPAVHQEVGRANHYLGRDAAPVGALAADQFPLDSNHP